jgi:hypothetical protein
MMNQLAERIGAVAVWMNPGQLVDKFLEWLDQVRVAMALAEIDGSARNGVPFD